MKGNYVLSFELRPTSGDGTRYSKTLNVKVTLSVELFDFQLIKKKGEEELWKFESIEVQSALVPSFEVNVRYQKFTTYVMQFNEGESLYLSFSVRTVDRKLPVAPEHTVLVFKKTVDPRQKRKAPRHPLYVSPSLTNERSSKSISFSLVRTSYCI